MQTISKYFMIGAWMLLFTAFLPTENTQAQIFGGTENDKGGKVGVCLGEPDLEEYPECENVNCKDKKNADNIMCLTEAQAGTMIAGNALSPTGITHTDNFADYIKKLVNFSLPYLTLAAFVGYVVAGFMYVTAFGNDEQLGKAKNILIWSSLGLILVILSFAITQLFTEQLVEGLNNNTNNDTPNINQLKNQ